MCQIRMTSPHVEKGMVQKNSEEGKERKKEARGELRLMVIPKSKPSALSDLPSAKPSGVWECLCMCPDRGSSIECRAMFLCH